MESNTNEINSKSLYRGQVENESAQGGWDYLHSLNTKSTEAYSMPFTETQNTWHNQAHSQNNYATELLNPVRKYGLYRLKRMSKMDPARIVSEITAYSEGFQYLLQGNIKPDWIVHIMRILAKVCEADFDENLSAILLNACCITFINQVEAYILSWTTKKAISDITGGREGNVTEVINNTLVFSETVNKHFAGKIMVEFSKFNFCITTDELVPNEFRKLQIFPTHWEILSNEPAFIRPNIVMGSYEDAEHYLDIHFRLLREDFMQPLREGIHTFVNQDYHFDPDDESTVSVTFFKGVRFLNTKILGSKVGYAFLFDPGETLKEVQWETSKRLINGSLLLFTKDNFQSVLVGTVADRNLTDVKNGIIVVEFLSSVNQKGLNDEFVMAETTVYFGSYRHVLAALQKIDVHNFPMERYLVKMERDIKPPNYLMQKLSPIYKIHDFNVRVLDIPSWPSAEKLEIDDSQCKALQSALTKEFVVIQGPPGTGKTFLALKVTEALLANVSEFPILVICYTNHALDQFLEGLLRYTTNLIRVGGQSQSEGLQKYNLQQKRKEFRKSRQSVDDWAPGSLFQCIRCLKNTQMNMTAVEGNKGIVSFRMLKVYEVISNTQYAFIMQCETSSFSVADWLYDNNEHITCDIWQDYKVSEDELSCEYFDLTFDCLGNKVAILREELSQLSEDIFDQDASEKLHEHKLAHHKMRYFEEKLSQYIMADENTHPRHVTDDLWKISYAERWELYGFWIGILKNKLQFELKRLQHFYETYQQREDYYILKDCEVIGMTTTRAARDQSLLQELKPKIVIVEEAAEVLESHIVASLTPHCEHLILIGDHKQLRPSPAVFEFAKKFHLDISLFERMVNNGLDCDQLKFQHRMRPEIASLIVPAIYPSLKNHSSVLEYKNVDGIAKNLYFVTHKLPEQGVPNSTSYRNTHEAKFLISLCRHLLLQGFSPSQITILAMYTGQATFLKELKKDDATLQQVCMTTVDNYQGEQNDIILLSLVRSNKRGIVGFLKTENRVCVALSRAKKGLYIIGNMDILRRGKSIWNKIYNTLKIQDAVGTHLPLKCQNHPPVLTHVASANDFKKKSPKGGCTETCSVKLQCGHKCKWKCHLTNREHENYICRDTCGRIKCELNHKCEKQCHEDCGPCMEPVRTVLPCKHYHIIACSLSSKTNPATLVCQEPCSTPLPCGHSCDRPCHIFNDPLLHQRYKCTKLCMQKMPGCKENHPCMKSCWEDCGSCSIRVKKNLPCGHMCITYCSSNSDNTLCSEKCYKVLPCGHPCPQRCGVKCGNCTANVTKRIPDCNHLAQVKCSETPSREHCRRKCVRVLPCGHRCNLMCKDPCSQYCQTPVWRVLPCGHQVSLPCCNPLELYECNEPHERDSCCACCTIL